MPAWKTCYACGTPLDAAKAAVAGRPVKPIASFEDKNPFGGGTVVAGMPPSGGKALRIDRSYVSMDQPQDWPGYDFLKADLYTDATKPLDLYVEIRDAGTRDYWTRVNYSTVVPPGESTLVIPVKQLYVGEKSRPGRMLDPGPDHPAGASASATSRPARSSWTTSAWSATTRRRACVFDGLHAFDFGTSTSPVMEASRRSRRPRSTARAAATG